MYDLELRLLHTKTVVVNNTLYFQPPHGESGRLRAAVVLAAVMESSRTSASVTWSVVNPARVTVTRRMPAIQRAAAIVRQIHC